MFCAQKNIYRSHHDVRLGDFLNLRNSGIFQSSSSGSSSRISSTPSSPLSSASSGFSDSSAVSSASSAAELFADVLLDLAFAESSVSSSSALRLRDWFPFFFLSF